MVYWLTPLLLVDSLMMEQMLKRVLDGNKLIGTIPAAMGSFNSIYTL